MRQIIVDFGTMHVLGHDLALRVYGYGLMLVLGFLLAIYLAQRRARRAGEDGEAVARCGMLALVGGIVGARLAYVIQQTRHGVSYNSIGDIFNITSGGLIYYGGVILATLMVLLYLRFKRLPIRRYLDILAPSLMFGLAFGRAGCLLNGCCYGGQCDASWALATSFPMYSKPLLKVHRSGNPYSQDQDSPSPVYGDQLDKGVVHPDVRLVNQDSLSLRLLPPRDLHGKLSSDQLATMMGSEDQARNLFKAIAPEGQITYEEWTKAVAASDGLLRGSESWDEALNYTRFDITNYRQARLTFSEVWRYLRNRKARIVKQFHGADGELSPQERARANEYLQADTLALAGQERSAPVRPAQLLSLLDALLLAGMLLLFSPLRKREGQVFALLLILYPVLRFLEESIRSNNLLPVWDWLHGGSRAGMVFTHNQYTSVLMMTIGMVIWLALRYLPASAGPAWKERAEAVGAAAGKAQRNKT